MATLAEHTVPEGPVQDLDKDAKLPDINLMVTAKDAETFVVDFSECTNSNANLQDAFLKYRKKRQKQIRKSRKKKVLLSPFRSDPARMWELRMKFIEQCKLYFGIPYAKRYWTTEDEHYHSKLFLDCCGLVRRVMRDLKREVGFKIGPWNQAYMFDTLPGNEKIEDMRPGDLVFIQATYYNPKMKKQPHDVTHVEVWLGEGEKTIGARWQKGVVQIFESYRFTASSYHSEKYVFKSIDPWLRGQCKSQCKTHQWKSRAEKFKPPKKSIFNIDDKQNKQQGHNSDSSEGHGNFSKPKTSISRQMNSNTYFKPILPSARKSAKKKKGTKKSVAKGAKKKSANKEGRQKEDGTSSQQQQQQQLHNQQQQQRQEPELDELQPVVSKREESQVSSQPVPLPRKSLLQRPVEAPRAAAHKDRSEIYKVPEPEEDKENFANGGPEPDEEEEENNTREKGDCEEEEEDEDDEDDSEEEEEILEPDEEEESDEDDEEAECEEEQDAEDTVGDSDLGYVGQREQAKNTLPNIFEEGNVNMVTAALPKDVTPLREGSGRITRLSLVHAPSSARPLSARSIIDDDDISVLNLQQEVPNFSLFPAARANFRSRSLIGSTLNFGAVSDLHYGAPYDVDDQDKYGGRGGSGGTSSNQDPRGFAAGKSTSGTGIMASQGPARGKTGDKEKRSPPDGDKPSGSTRKVTLASGKEPTFFIGGGNGVSLVEGPLTELGWKRITDKANENYKLKWVECKNTINYNAFKEGDQLVNHIPNCNLLTNKMGLLSSLQSFDKLNTTMRRRDTKLKLSDFMPETFKLDDPKERDQFIESFDVKDIWICKPTGMNQGKGIYLVRDLDEFKVTLQERDEKLQQTRRPPRANMGRIIQRYLTHPLLLEGRKFDIRAYMLVANTVPYLVLYHKGYVRLSLQDYDLANHDLTAHLTNQYIQKRDPSYKEEKESTAWSMDKFNDYVNENVADLKGVEADWVYNTLTTKMKQIMQYCFHAVKNRLQCKIGYFDLYGLDFMVDAEMKVWLIEVNVNPSLATNCEALKEVIPGVVKETIHLTLECYEKSRRGQALMPLNSLKNFDILFNGCTKSKNRSTPGASTAGPGAALSPIRRQRSRSPTKELTSHNSKTPNKGQSLSEARNAKAMSGMTPKATRTTLPATATATAPAPPQPALRGALPPSGSQSKKALIANSVLQGEKIKLKMTHNEDSDSPSSAKSLPKQKTDSSPTDEANGRTLEGEEEGEKVEQNVESNGEQVTDNAVAQKDSDPTQRANSTPIKANGRKIKPDKPTGRTKLPPAPRTRTTLRSSKRRSTTPDRGN